MSTCGSKTATHNCVCTKCGDETYAGKEHNAICPQRFDWCQNWYWHIFCECKCLKANGAYDDPSMSDNKYKDTINDMRRYEVK